jgi:integrase
MRGLSRQDWLRQNWKKGPGEQDREPAMKQNNVIRFSGQRRRSKGTRKRDRHNEGKRGRVYNRGGKLWVDFRYLGERVRESSGMEDNHNNRIIVRNQLDLVMAEIDNGVFEFAERFPLSKKKGHFTLLEGRTSRKGPEDVLFGAYVDAWFKAMEQGMSLSQIRDYRVLLKNHLLPFFGDLPFSDFTPVLTKKFIAELRGKKSPHGRPLSTKYILNIMSPLRVLARDAVQEYGWTDFADPFFGLKFPRARKTRVNPFGFGEWRTLMELMTPWYVPYFEFAVLTGLRPSEQVALKWAAIDEQYIHIELSRVRNMEKADLKTEESRRWIEIRPSIQGVLEKQKEMAEKFNSPYVFVNTQGRPILQDKLRELWGRVMKKSGLPYRRMYETRHTFASWALATGETPEWVAKAMGHADTSMIYRTYGRYIPNLTRQDGSAFEKQYMEAVDGKNNVE